MRLSTIFTAAALATMIASSAYAQTNGGQGSGMSNGNMSNGGSGMSHGHSSSKSMKNNNMDDNK